MSVIGGPAVMPFDVPRPVAPARPRAVAHSAPFSRKGREKNSLDRDDDVYKSRAHRRRRLRRHRRRAYIRSVYFLPSLATLGNAAPAGTMNSCPRRQRSI